MSTTATRKEQGSWDYDVVIVGGGPAGCSAGVFTARAGLDTIVFDRGSSSLRRCAHLENYLGFPAGVGIERFYELMHDHAETAGCVVRSDLVESVERREGGGFRVEPQDEEPVMTRRVIAAAKYDAEYLRAVDDGSMFVTESHGGEEHERFDREYPGPEGSTPVDGLYVASPSEDSIQAITAAGHGTRVARRLLKDLRTENGWWDPLADSPDWVRRVEGLEKGAERADWEAKFDKNFAEKAPVDPSTDRYQRVRDRVIDDRSESYITEAEMDERDVRGQRRLLDHVDDDLILERARDIETERESTD
jgi:hypothetical protein